ncbi:MAG TPA: hypothetical protein VMW62_06090 [Chloroflexota bacterium]|nr:hypothetical protein [Chloroflexota bacterium]
MTPQESGLIRPRLYTSVGLDASFPRYTELLSLRAQVAEIGLALQQWERPASGAKQAMSRQHLLPPLALRALGLALGHRLQRAEAAWDQAASHCFAA